MLERLSRVAPGIPDLLNYKRSNFPADLVAGISVAAVALPVGVAYAQLAGFRPEAGLYVSILPPLLYALFGTSRQLIIGPDAATCALVAASIAPLAGGDKQLYLSLSMTLAFLAGLFCIAASFLRLGVLADFLSKPILVGYLNGIALHIALGQIGKLFGFPILSDGIVPRLGELASKLKSTHPASLAVGAAALLILVISPRLVPRIPPAQALKTFYRVDRREVAISLMATLGVAGVGAIQGILVAVLLALLRFIKLVSRPAIEILGSVPDEPGFHSVDRHRNAQTLPGLVLFRFNGPVVFFNAAYFKRSVLQATATTQPVKWVVVDMVPINVIDLSGILEFSSLFEQLQERGITLATAGREAEWKSWAQRHRVSLQPPAFPTLDAAVSAYQHTVQSA